MSRSGEARIMADPRIKRKPRTWLGFAITYIILLVLAAGQAMIFARYVGFSAMPIEYVFGMLGYWALASGGFIAVVAWQKRTSYDKPMRQLSAAARQVAKGDFAVCLEPAHLPNKADYVDVMFEDFNSMVAGLASTESLKDDFIADVSHEIKTPLAAISNYATILRDESLTPDKRRECTDGILTATARLSALVSNILKLNKLENAGITADAKPYDIVRQLSEVALGFAEAADAKGISLEAELEDKAMVAADEGMLEVVWANLLSNAVKFTPEGGLIQIMQTSDASTVTVTVKDSGQGMDAATMERIFDKFFQGGTVRTGEGNGLGLALTRRIIELMGASVHVTSEPGHGTSFSVSLKAQL
jgi:signal transduction histidine kinase